MARLHAPTVQTADAGAGAAAAKQGYTSATERGQCTPNAAITLGTTGLTWGQPGGGALAVEDEGASSLGRDDEFYRRGGDGFGRAGWRRSAM